MTDDEIEKYEHIRGPRAEGYLRGIRAGKAERDKLAARVAELEAALRFYAERMTYTARSGMECGITRDHFGDRARRALKDTAHG